MAFLGFSASVENLFYVYAGWHFFLIQVWGVGSECWRQIITSRVGRQIQSKLGQNNQSGCGKTAVQVYMQMMWI